MPLSIGVAGTSRNIVNIYVGVNGVARRFTKAYIGDGWARQFFGELPGFPITSTVIGAGRIDGLFSRAEAGHNVEFHVIPDNRHVADIESVTMNGTPLYETAGYQDGSRRYDFSMPNGPAHVVATFSGDYDWQQVEGWDTYPSGEWNSPYGEAVYWDFWQPPWTGDFMLKGSIRYAYQPMPPFEFQFRAGDTLHSEGGVIFIDQYGSFSFAPSMGVSNSGGWILENFEWAVIE